MMPSNRGSKTWGYAQASEYERVKSAEQQAEAIRKKAIELDGVWAGCRIERDLWATKAGFSNRPEFKRLLKELQPGDRLIVWRLDRIDRNPFVLVRAVEMLVNRGIRLCVLDFQGMELNLDASTGRVFATVLAAVAKMFKQRHREATKHALENRKQCGSAYNRYPPLGRRRVVKDGLKMDVWDERECQHICEIKRRYEAGESMAEIARDFYKRGLKTASGQPWVRPYGRWKRRLNANRLHRAYRWYSDLLAKGQDLLGIPAIKVDSPERVPRVR